MKFLAIVVVCLAAIQQIGHAGKATLPLRERLALLKYQIAREIEKEKKTDDTQRYQSDVSASLEKYEYVDTDKLPITPINENDERKKHGRFRLRQLKTTTETLWTRPRVKSTKKRTTKATIEDQEEIVADDALSSGEEHKPRLIGIDEILNISNNSKRAKTLREKLKLNFHVQPPTNIFYRRIFDGRALKSHCTKETIHCIDLITPILTGQKVNITQKKVLTYRDHEVTKLLHLLSEDTTDMTKDEIYSSLYQISNLQIRLFQWDIASLKMLFNVLNKGNVKKHTWMSLKNGLKRTLFGWHLDFTNVTNLLLQARIFRPPCIAGDDAGSTQSSKAIRFTKKVKPRCSQGNSGSCEFD